MNTASKNFEIFKTLLLKQVDVVNFFHAAQWGETVVLAENIHEVGEFHFFGDTAVLEYPELCRGEYNAMLENAAEVGVQVKAGDAAGNKFTFYLGAIDPVEIDKAYAINQSVGDGVYALERAEWERDRSYFLSIHNKAC